MSKKECPIKISHTEQSVYDGEVITNYEYQDCCGTACPLWVHDSGGGHCGLAVK